jgi:hypothetical protein
VGGFPHPKQAVLNTDPVQDLADVRAAFVDPVEFWSSPLYRRLSSVVAADPFLVGLAANARPGQGPTFAFFGAVQFLLLSAAVPAGHPLGDYYPSLRGESARPADDAAGAALTSFAHEHAASIRRLLETRLVQTNHVQRAVALRLGLAAVATQVGEAPVHLLEIGSSAGLVLRHERYGYLLAGRAYGDRHSPVQLVTQWRSDEDAPDLDAVPRAASTTGIDLNPLDPTSEQDRLWLAALVWPEDRHKAELLRTALAVAVDHPVATLAGDAAGLCPRWAAALPSGQPRVAFHCATRMHVPVEHRPAFDRAIDAAGVDGPLYRIAVEGDGLVVTGPDGTTIVRYDVDGHLAWAKPA